MRRVQEAKAPEQGMTRLYRYGEITPNMPKQSLDDVMDGPFGQKMTRRQFHEMLGDQHPNQFGARGRWFTDAPEELDFYVADNWPDELPAYYVDVPENEVPELNVRNTPYSKASRNHDREFIMGDKHFGNAARLMGLLAPLLAPAMQEDR